MRVDFVNQALSTVRGLVVVRAWRTAAPGLVIHPDVDGKGYWVVTHAATGTFVAGCLSWTAALDYANRLGKVADWCRPAADLIADEVLRSFVRRTRPTLLRGSHTAELNDPNDGNKVTGTHPTRPLAITEATF